jgi:hypothetical protein
LSHSCVCPGNIRSNVSPPHRQRTVPASGDSSIVASSGTTQSFRCVGIGIIASVTKASEL